MRTRRKLVEKTVNAPLKLRPIVSETMQLEHILPQPTPEFFNRIESGRIGRQPNRFDTRQGIHHSQHIHVRVDRPVVLNDIDVSGGRIKPIDDLIHITDDLTSDNVVVQVVHLSRQSVQDTNDAPLFVDGLCLFWISGGPSKEIDKLFIFAKTHCNCSGVCIPFVAELQYKLILYFCANDLA